MALSREDHQFMAGQSVYAQMERGEVADVTVALDQAVADANKEYEKDNG